MSKSDTARITQIGWFFEGQMMGWKINSNGRPPEEVLRIDPEGRVLVGGIEIVSWTNSRKKSLVRRDWIAAGG